MHRLTQTQLDVLQAHYTRSRYITIEIRDVVSRQTGLTPKEVATWFQNQRSKDRLLNRLPRLNPQPKQDPQPGPQTPELKSVAQARLTTAQIVQLEQLFAKTKNLSIDDVNAWAVRIGTTSDNIRTWYWDKRIKRRQFRHEQWQVRELEQFLDANS